MSNQANNGRKRRERSPYKIIKGSAYEGRGGFRAVCGGLAVLSLAGITAAMPQAAFQRSTVSLEGAAAPAVIVEESQTDASVFYTSESLVSFSVPELADEAQLPAMFGQNDMKREEGDFSAFTSAPDSEEIRASLEQIRLEKEAAEREAKERAARIARQQEAQAVAKNSYVGLNSAGIPMSQKSGYVELDENGVPVNYAYCITGKATAYTADSITSTGTRPIQGTVAVNPRQIPYGTRMWITSADGRYVYGLAVAEDTGGFIYFTNGATVDLYMYSESDCDAWGFRTANIYILD